MGSTCCTEKSAVEPEKTKSLGQSLNFKNYMIQKLLSQSYFKMNVVVVRELLKFNRKGHFNEN